MADAAVTSSALAVLEDARGRVLLLRRARGARLGAGRWGLPGGRCEPGETPAQCIARELAEEIGHADLEFTRCIGPVPNRCQPGSVYLFHCHWPGGTVVLNTEHTRSAWVAAPEYRRYAVLDGVAETLARFGVWPDGALDPARLPDVTSE